MLVLSRKIEESVVVGGADGLKRLLKVTVLGIRNGIVKLGFEADDDVPVDRFEVWEHLVAQKWGDTSERDQSQQVDWQKLTANHNTIKKQSGDSSPWNLN